MSESPKQQSDVRLQRRILDNENNVVCACRGTIKELIDCLNTCSNIDACQPDDYKNILIIKPNNVSRGIHVYSNEEEGSIGGGESLPKIAQQCAIEGIKALSFRSKNRNESGFKIESGE
jgi:hypothetical protein